MIRIVTLNTNCSEYDIRDAAACSMTVRELIDELECNYKDDDKIVFSNDNGYTYGYVTADHIAEHNVETREEEEARENAEEYADNMESLRDELLDLIADYDHTPDPDDEFDSDMSEEEYLERRKELFEEYGITEKEYNEYYKNNN